jgi:hypothetical protein
MVKTITRQLDGLSAMAALSTIEQRLELAAVVRSPEDAKRLGLKAKLWDSAVFGKVWLGFRHDRDTGGRVVQIYAANQRQPVPGAKLFDATQVDQIVDLIDAAVVAGATQKCISVKTEDGSRKGTILSLRAGKYGSPYIHFGSPDWQPTATAGRRVSTITPL